MLYMFKYDHMDVRIMLLTCFISISCYKLILLLLATTDRNIVLVDLVVCLNGDLVVFILLRQWNIIIISNVLTFHKSSTIR